MLWNDYFKGFPDRFAQRQKIARLIATGGTRPVAGAVLVQVVAGVLPVLFVLATAQVIARVPAAVSGGVHSADWHRLRTELILAAAVFFAVQLLLPVQAFLGELLRRRIDAHARDRFMAASFTGGAVAVLEDPELLDQAVDGINMMRVAAWTPGAACAGLIALGSRYLQTVLAAVLVSVAFAWWAGIAVLFAGLVIRIGYRYGLSLFGDVIRAQMRARRRQWYFHDLLLTAEPAKEIRVFGLLDWVQGQYRTASMAVATPVWRARRRIFYGPYVLYTLTAFVLLSTVLVTTARATANGLLGIGGFMIVMQASLSAIRIGAFIAESDVQTEYGMMSYRSLQRFEELTGNAEQESSSSTLIDLPDRTPRQEIRFDKVTFRYRPDGPAVLDELDLVIPAGESLAIVGLNGAGKTTLVKLLARLYEPTSGVITVDGIDLRTLPVAQWQRRVAAIFQDFVHFELSVRENVGFGAVELLRQPDRGETAIWSALERAGAKDFVAELPAGLDTPLSRQYTDGTDLSGGQWQRIAIARALLAVEGTAQILVLDEPTANLDVRAEVEFFDRFLELTRGATSIVISHRFSTVRRADRIAVLEHGRVIEDGTHHDLLARDGRYAELFTLQAARFTDDEQEDEQDEQDEQVGANHG